MTPDTKPALAIELCHLRYFLAAAEHGSFRKAGAALDVQESTISRRVRDLEDQIGASLFHRHNGGVRLHTLRPNVSRMFSDQFHARGSAIVSEHGLH